MVPLSFTGETFCRDRPTARCSGRPRTRCSSPICTLKKRAGSRGSGSSFRPTICTRRSTALAPEVERTGATRLYCLGDSFHDTSGCDRFRPSARDLLTGSHRPPRLDVDRRQPRSGLRRPLRRQARRRGRGCRIILRHEAVRSEPRPEMSGHFHPKLRISLKRPPASRAAASSPRRPS